MRFVSNGMKNILFIAGARPNFMKISALAKAAEKYKDRIKINLIHTGQHYDDEMSRIFFNEFNLPEPIANLGVGSGERVSQIKAIREGLAPHFLAIKPDLVIVVGDVNSTIAAASEAVRSGVPLAHVEAGLRSFNWRMPEEINRVMTDHLSDLLFATEESAILNLKNEGVPQEKIHLAGNVMIDTLLHFSDLAESSAALEKNELKSKEYALATIHRSENTEDIARFKELILTLEEINKFSPVVCPLHPRTKNRLAELGLTPQFKIIFPQSYFDFLKLQKNAKFIITDSGGIQEEASVLKIPCITVRTETERPATVEYGTNEIVGVEKESIVAAAKRAASGEWKKGGAIPLWDGKAAERILEIIVKYLNV